MLVSKAGITVARMPRKIAWFALASSILLFFWSSVPALAQGCSLPATATPDAIIASCSQFISGGKLYGRPLSGIYVDRGNVYFRMGNFDRAIEDYDAATRADPKFAIPYFNRGLAYAAKKQTERAFQEYDQAIRLDPKYLSALIKRSEIYRSTGDVDRAIQDGVAAVQLEPKNPEAYFTRASGYNLKKDYDAAIRDLDEAIQLRPNYVAAHGLRGFAYYSKEDYATAIASFDRSIQLDPKYYFGFHGRALAFLNKKDFDRAISDFTSAIELTSAPAGDYADRGRAYYTKGDVSSALIDYNQAIRLGSPNRGVYYNRGLALRKAGDTDGALRDFNEAIRLYAEYLVAYTNRGLIYESKGDIESARRDYVAAVGMTAKESFDKWGFDTAKARLAVLNGSSPISLPPVAINPPVNVPAVRPGNAAERRMALVIGNGAYKVKSLANPVNDARAISSAFRQLGFEVTEGFDLDFAGMRRAISEFVVRASSAQLSVVYYAGHGIQVQGHNYLVPTDARLESARAANFELFDLDQIIATLDDPVHTTIIILDACRNNPFEMRTSNRAVDAGGGLVGYSGGSQGMMIAYATTPGKVAEDGSGEHSPFTGALLKYITTPDLEILDVFRNVRQAVIRETGGKQIPWETNSLVGEVYLAGTTRKASAK